MAVKGVDGVVKTSYSGKQTAEIVGITYRQLDYWARTDLVRPSLADAQGSGSRRAYSYQDTAENSLWDVAANMAGWWLADCIAGDR